MSAPAQNPRPAPVQHDADDARVRLGLADRLPDLEAHLVGPGIQRLRAVERDRGDGILDLVQDLLVPAHGASSAGGAVLVRCALAAGDRRASFAYFASPIHPGDCWSVTDVTPHW